MTIKQGYIYIITYDECQKKNQYKIGRTQDSSKLHSRYRTYFPTDPIIIEVWSTYDCYEAEDRVFDKLDKYRIHDSKEWFEGDLKLFRKECRNITNSVNKSFGIFSKLGTSIRTIIKNNTKIKKKKKSEWAVPYYGKCALFKVINWII